MMRAARFTAQLGLDPVAEVEAAMRDMADRIAIISAERIQVELFKLMTGIDPARASICWYAPMSLIMFCPKSPACGWRPMSIIATRTSISTH